MGVGAIKSTAERATAIQFALSVCIVTPSSGCSRLVVGILDIPR